MVYQMFRATAAVAHHFHPMFRKPCKNEDKSKFDNYTFLSSELQIKIQSWSNGPELSTKMIHDNWIGNDVNEISQNSTVLSSNVLVESTYASLSTLVWISYDKKVWMPGNIS